MITAARPMSGVTSSSTNSAPSAIATTGLTYAYVATCEIGACLSSHA